jgi:uncharacterized protein (DUF924 family)
MTTPHDILAFWREAGKDRWYAKDDAFDAEIARRFGDAHREAVAGRLDRWDADPAGALALVILLDQFSRNMFRGSSRAFAADAKARDIAVRAIASGHDRAVDDDLRPFFYLPFMHSEDLADQDVCVGLYEASGDVDGARWARLHRDIVARFGRFPHRNVVLGRDTTPQEEEYLAGDGFKG